MNNDKQYIIPVEFKVVRHLIVNAPTQTTAIKKLNETIKNNPIANEHYDSFKVLNEDIVCDKDDDMLDAIIQDFKLETEIAERPIVMDEDEDIENKEFEIFSSDISIDGGGMPECINSTGL